MMTRSLLDSSSKRNQVMNFLFPAEPYAVSMPLKHILDINNTCFHEEIKTFFILLVEKSSYLLIGCGINTSRGYINIMRYKCNRQVVMFTNVICRPRWLSWMRRPTGDQEVAGSTPAEVGNILSWRLIMKYFLRSFSPFRWFKKGSCQFLAKECAQYWLTA